MREGRRLSEVHYVYVEYNPTMIELAGKHVNAAAETQRQKCVVTIDDPVRYASSRFANVSHMFVSIILLYSRQMFTLFCDCFAYCEPTNRRVIRISSPTNKSRQKRWHRWSAKQMIIACDLGNIKW